MTPQISVGTKVQWRGVSRIASVPGMSIDPLAQQEETTDRLSLDLPVSVVKFLERFASYRNALNSVQGRSVKKWTRKSAAEAFVAAQVRQVVESMAGAIETHGELPEDDKEMVAYARAVLAATEPAKSPKKSR